MRNSNNLFKMIPSYSNLTGSSLLLTVCLTLGLSVNSTEAAMVAYWPWDNSITDATGDVSPDGVLEPAATPPGFSTTASPYGGSHSLDEGPVNSRFRIPYQDAVKFGNGNDFTLSFWIRPDSSGSNVNGRIFDSRGTGAGGTAAGLQIKINETNGSGWALSNVYVDNGSTGLELISTGTGYSDNAWHHVGVTYDSVAEQIRFFVDGSPETGLISTASVGNFDGGKDLSLGAEIYASNVLIPSADARTQKFTGLMDEFAIFNEVLSDAQIAQLHAGTLLPSSFLPPPPIPEPSSAMLLGLGLLGLAKYTRRRKQ